MPKIRNKRGRKRKKGRKEGKGEKKRKRRKKKRGKFSWNCMAPSTSRHKERVAPKAPRGAKNISYFNNY